MTTLRDALYTLLDRRAPALSAEALSDVFDRLIWILDDNGAVIADVRREWLRGTDRYAVEVALAMQETLPFKTLEEFEPIAADIISRWPDLARACEVLKSGWAKAGPDSSIG